MSETIKKVTCNTCEGQFKVRESVYQKRLAKLAKVRAAQNLTELDAAELQAELDDSYTCRNCRKNANLTFNGQAKPIKVEKADPVQEPEVAAEVQEPVEAAEEDSEVGFMHDPFEALNEVEEEEEDFEMN